MDHPSCQHIAPDGVACPRLATEGAFCSDHSPDALERLRQRLAAREARRCTYVEDTGRCFAQAIEDGRCARHAPDAIERNLREQHDRAVEAASARLDSLRAQVEALERSKTAAEAKLRELLSQTEEQKAQHRRLEREGRDLRAEHRRLADLIQELEHRHGTLSGACSDDLSASDAKAEALVARAVHLLSASEVSEQDRLLAEACTKAAHEHRLWRAFIRRSGRSEGP